MSYVIIISRDFSKKKKKGRREEFVNVTSGRVSFLGPDALFGGLMQLSSRIIVTHAS